MNIYFKRNSQEKVSIFKKRSKFIKAEFIFPILMHSIRTYLYNDNYALKLYMYKNFTYIYEFIL
jgi:hypothetical protein